MAVQVQSAEPVGEHYDIFLCTRDLPDALTGETAALRQLCSALLGDGYRVFFPPVSLAGKNLEEREASIQAALRSARVMVAAAVGEESADESVRRLWSAYRDLAAEDPGRTLIPCLRDLDAVPEELSGLEVLDMGDLGFLSGLKEKLSPLLAPAPEALPDKEAEEPAAAEAEPPAMAEEESAPSKPRWPWLVLAVGAVVIVALVLALLLK